MTSSRSYLFWSTPSVMQWRWTTVAASPKPRSTRAGSSAGGGDDLKLLGTWPSPFVHRVGIALHLKGLTYENVEEDLWNKSELLLTSNPVHKKVPVLIHNGKPICESMIIVQYIDEAFVGAGPSIVPPDPYKRAIARFWAAYVEDKFVNSWVQVVRGRTAEEKAAAVAPTFAALETLEGAFRECSKGKGFFGGDGVGYVDIALGSFVAWMNASEAISGVKLLDGTRTPLLAAWAERFCALDAAKAVLPDDDRIVELVKMMRAKAAATAAAAAVSN